MGAAALVVRVRAARVRRRLRALPSQQGRLRERALTRTLIAAALFIALALAVAAGVLRAVDDAMLALAQRPASSWLDLAASVVSLAGATSVTLGVALGLVVARLRGRRPEALVPLAIIVVGAIELACKALVPQPLPPHELSRGIELIPTVHVPTAFAFPSGHVARLTFLLSITPVPRWLGLVAVLLMAVTRLYLAEHWLSDVVGGALLGLAVARAARSLGSMRR